MAVKVKVDSEGCISCGACVAICPAVFEFNEENKSIVKKQPETAEEIECVKQSEAACPVKVIYIEEVKAVNNSDYKLQDLDEKVA